MIEREDIFSLELKKRLTRGLLFGSFMALLSCSPAKESAESPKIGKIDKDALILAEVGKEKITLRQFEEAYLSYVDRDINRVRSSSLEKRLKYLKRMVWDKKRLLEAYELNMEGDPNFLDLLEGYKKRILIQKLHEEEVVHKVINEERIKRAYRDKGEEVYLHHIIVPENKAHAQAKIEPRKAVAEALWKKAEAGEDFKAIIAGVKGMAKDGSHFITLFDLSAMFHRAVDDFKERELFPLFKDGLGYHIVRLGEGRTPKNQRPYEEVKKFIFINLQERLKTELEAYRLQYVEEVKKEFSYKIDKEMIKTIAEEIRWHEKHPRQIQIHSKDIILGPFDALKERHRVLARYLDKNFTLLKMLKEIRKFTPDLLRKEDLAKALEEYVTTIIEGEFLAAKALKLGLDKRPWFKEEMARYRKKTLLMMNDGLYLYSKITVSEEEMREHYEKNKKRYIIPETRNVRELWVRDQKLAWELYERALKGEDFIKLINKYSKGESNPTLPDGEIGWFIDDEWADLSIEAFKLKKIGDLSRPFPYFNGYSIVQLIGIKGSELIPFEQKKVRLGADIKKIKAVRQRDEWVVRLEKLFPSKIYEERLREAFKDI